MTNLQAFYTKLQNWLRKVMQGTFLCLRNCQLLKKLKNLQRIWRHLQYNRPPSLSWNWVPMIFLWAQEDVFLRNSFSTFQAIANNLEQVHDQFFDLGHESSAHDTFHELPFSQFWWAVSESYPHPSKLALWILLSLLFEIKCYEMYFHGTNVVTVGFISLEQPFVVIIMVIIYVLKKE